MASTAINPVQLEPATFARMVLEDKLDTFKAGGYAYAWGKEHPPVLYRCFDSWDAVPVSTAATADPAAGANPAAVTVPAGRRYRILSVYAQVATDATVVSRRASVIVTDGTNNLGGTSSSVTQAASLTINYGFQQTAVVLTALAVDPNVNIISFPDLVLEAGWTVQFVLQGIQAGDNIGPMRYTYQEVIV